MQLWVPFYANFRIYFDETLRNQKVRRSNCPLLRPSFMESLYFASFDGQQVVSRVQSNPILTSISILTPCINFLADPSYYIVLVRALSCNFLINKACWSNFPEDKNNMLCIPTDCNYISLSAAMDTVQDSLVIVS